MISYEYYPGEVAENIAQLAYIDKLTDRKALTDFMYYLKACADNKYNYDYFRVVWSALQTICEKVERGDIC